MLRPLRGDVRRTAVLGLLVVVVLAGCAGVTPGDDAPATTGPGAGTTAPGTDGSPAGDGPNGTLEVHFVNVGQSAATLVVGPTGETMLIDTGHFTDDGEHVLDYLRAHGIERIDYLVVSHNDADHIGGNAAVIDYYETEADGVGAVYDPGIAASTATYREYLDAVERHDVALYETRAGDAIPFAGVDVTVMGPPDPYLADRARNENNVVLHLQYGETGVLLTGDAEDEQERHLVEEYGDRLDATVLKAGHHGSSTSTSDALLDAVDPAVVAISSAYDSRYGHPHEEVLQRLADRGVPTYWTATHGTVVFRSDGERVTAFTQYEAPTDAARLREGDPAPLGASEPVEARQTFGGSGTVGGGATTAGGTGDGTTATDGGSEGRLALVEVHADAEGDDRENPNDEYLVLENAGDATLDLSGWTVSDAAGHTYTFPDGTTLAPGERLTLYSGSGTDTESAYYWGEGAVWNNGGDVVVVEDATGRRVLREEYP